MKSIIRKWLIPMHRWTALSFGIVLVMTAITGASIAFRPQLEININSNLLTAPTCTKILPIDDFADRAKSLRPDATLDYIRMIVKPLSNERMHAVMIRYTDQNFVYFNPCSGEVLGQRHRYGGVLGTIEQFHRWRFIQNGSLVTGTTAILGFFILGIGGLISTIALKSKPNLLIFKQGLTGLPRRIDIHKTIGVYAALFIMVMALTGLPQAYDWYRKGIYTLSSSEMPKPPPKIKVSGGESRISYEQLWQKGQALVPGFTDALMHFPEDPAQSVDMFAIPADASHANARTLMWFDPYSGQVLKHLPYDESSLGFKIYFWTLSLHSGKVGGWAGQTLLFIGALTVPILFYTGLSAYLQRRKRLNQNETSTKVLTS